jgi:hypothetical protein
MHRLLFPAIIGAIQTILLLQVSLVASSVPRRQAEVAATSFCRAIVSSGEFSYYEFGGRIRRRMKPLLSKRLLASLDNVRDCGRDWARHQPSNSTDKPPFVDCCVFSDSADWSPTSFALQNSSLQPDGRRRVTIEYRFDSPYEHPRWHVAVYIVKEDGRYVVDDFEGGLDKPSSDHWFALEEGPQCKHGKWVAPY